MRKKHKDTKLRFKDLSDLVCALNSGNVQINEVPNIIEASGWRHGDCDYVLAIDDLNHTLLSYCETKDLFIVESI